MADDRLIAEIMANMFAGVALARASDAVILFANPRYSEMFGYAPGELEGQPVSILNAPTERTPEETALAIISSLEKQGSWKGSVENIRKNGERVWTQASVSTFEHPAYGKVWVIVQLDITAQKRVEEALKRSEERLDLVLQAIGCGAWDWNIQTGEVIFSPLWISSLGYDPSEVAPNVSFWEQLVHPDDLPRVRDALAKHFSGLTPYYECADRLRRKDGSWQWNLDRGRVVERTAQGEPLRMVGADTDLSRQQWTGLKEFVPICAGCKKIREDDGRWQSLEAHFEELSRAQFSHGICPDCMQRLYGEIPEMES
ncbi:MAG TPA: PAS domain-containing protein [Holophagaceae bacterium]|nr:PAS domain-containing protein [Holophagaceae bacterium]